MPSYRKVSRSASSGRGVGGGVLDAPSKYIYSVALTKMIIPLMRLKVTGGGGALYECLTFYNIKIKIMF